MSKAVGAGASFDVLDAERSRVVGLLEFSTVTWLLPLGATAISAGQAAKIDLAGVTGSDSSGLALLIEWLSIARGLGRQLDYENMPAQLHQLARLSEVEDLLMHTGHGTGVDSPDGVHRP